MKPWPERPPRRYYKCMEFADKHNMSFRKFAEYCGYRSWELSSFLLEEDVTKEMAIAIAEKIGTTIEDLMGFTFEEGETERYIREMKTLTLPKSYLN